MLSCCNAMLSRLELIWIISRLQISKKCVYAKKLCVAGLKGLETSLNFIFSNIEQCTTESKATFFVRKSVNISSSIQAIIWSQILYVL